MYFPLHLEVFVAQPFGDMHAVFFQDGVDIRRELHADDPPLFTIEEADRVAAGPDCGGIDDADALEAETEPPPHSREFVRDTVDDQRRRPGPERSVTLFELLPEIDHALT